MAAANDRELEAVVRGLVERTAEQWVKELLPGSPHPSLVVAPAHPALLWQGPLDSCGSLHWEVSIMLYGPDSHSARRIRVCGTVTSTGVYRSFITNQSRTAYLWFESRRRRELNGMSAFDLNGGVPIGPDGHTMVIKR